MNKKEHKDTLEEDLKDANAWLDKKQAEHTKAADEEEKEDEL